MSLYVVEVKNEDGIVQGYLGLGRIKRLENATIFSSPSAAQRARDDYAKTRMTVLPYSKVAAPTRTPK